ncbi:MAG: PHP domain-containing protein [Halobacteriota archaeon]
MHTNYSDGTDGLEAILKKAGELNYEYIGITDHSRSGRISGGLEVEELKEQWDEIDSICHKCEIKILKGAEVDILPDGSLDYPEEILKELDLVVGGINSNFESSSSYIFKFLPGIYILILDSIVNYMTTRQLFTLIACLTQSTGCI